MQLQRDQYFVLNQNNTGLKKKSRKGLLIAGSLVVVGTIAAVCMMNSK
jgi:C1A family cysteine protease